MTSADAWYGICSYRHIVLNPGTDAQWRDFRLRVIKAVIKQAILFGGYLPDK
jgi:hypothetical protein